MTKKRKTQILESCVFSKLLYGLESCMLLKADRDRIDGFQARCLRRILKILPAWLSRVSNAEVRERADVPPLTSILLERQLKLYGKLARDSANSLPRQMVFEAGQTHSCLPRDWKSRRSRGRPRIQWTTYLHAEALAVAGNDPGTLQALLHNPSDWHAAVRQRCAL